MTKQRTRIATSKDRRPRSKAAVAKSRHVKVFPLFELPEDIGYEIFSYLDPKDLLSLIDVNTRIHSILLDPSISFVWRTARLHHHEDAPAPMEGISESRWAQLLLDRLTCEICGGYGGKCVINIQKRTCISCLVINGIRCEDVASIYPNLDDSTLELVPQMLGTIEHKRSYFYPRDELEVVIAALRSFDDDDEQCFYIEKRKKLLAQEKEVERTVRDWHRSEELKKSEMNWRLKRERRTAVKDRLVKMGYTEDDADCWEVFRLPCIRRAAPLTDRSWAMIRNQVVDTINRRKMRRRHEVLDSRNAMISRAYLDFKRSVLGSTWRTFPSPHVISLLNPVHHIKVSQETDITEARFKVAMDSDLRASIDRWTKRQRKFLLKRVNLYGGVDRWRNFRYHLYNEDERFPEAEEVPDFVQDDMFNMELAVVEIICRRCKQISRGMSAAIRHLHCDACTGWKPGELEAPKKSFGDVRLSRTVASCIVREGLDPWSATVDEMDQRNWGSRGRIRPRKYVEHGGKKM
ncbi:hypothetical protein VNI00_017854 [Paramarasmius palmivorus]|uniref:F-box domain-containing protein n=1 Tax=Paramarasmius palmivorus TaxID=297713 RepID=A0AAW0B2F7_9AGAR